MMLGSQNKSLKSTALSSSKKGNMSVKKDGFFVYAYKRMWQLMNSFWNRCRRLLWVSSTGFIFLIMPFAFAYISEFQRQAMLMESKGGMQ